MNATHTKLISTLTSTNSAIASTLFNATPGDVIEYSLLFTKKDNTFVVRGVVYQSRRFNKGEALENTTERAIEIASQL